LVVGANRDAGEGIGAGPVNGHAALVPAGGVGAGRRRAGDRRRGAVDLDAADRAGADVSGLVLDRDGPSAEVAALAGDQAVGRLRRRIDAGQAVLAGPVDRDVTLVPAGGVGVGRRRAGQRRHGAVDVDAAHARVAGVAGVVLGLAGDRLPGA